MSSTLVLIFKEMFIIPSEKEQLSNLSKSLDQGFSSYNDLKSPKLTSELANFFGLDIDFEKSKKENKDDFVIKNYNLIKNLRWVFILMFCMLVFVYYQNHNFYYMPLFSMLFAFFSVSRSLVKIKNSFYGNLIRQYLDEKDIKSEELRSLLSKFYILKTTSSTPKTENIPTLDTIDNIKKKRRL